MNKFTLVMSQIIGVGIIATSLTACNSGGTTHSSPNKPSSNIVTSKMFNAPDNILEDTIMLRLSKSYIETKNGAPIIAKNLSNVILRHPNIRDDLNLYITNNGSDWKWNISKVTIMPNHITFALDVKNKNYQDYEPTLYRIINITQQEYDHINNGTPIGITPHNNLPMYQYVEEERDPNKIYKQREYRSEGGMREE
ncbi:MAG: hypothetical protein PHC75_01900 [Burkholderiales bacterium]|nr:hypothetical protein [Burkholderiales bacterium]